MCAPIPGRPTFAAEPGSSRCCPLNCLVHFEFNVGNTRRRRLKRKRRYDPFGQHTLIWALLLVAIQKAATAVNRRASCIKSTYSPRNSCPLAELLSCRSGTLSIGRRIRLGVLACSASLLNLQSIPLEFSDTSGYKRNGYGTGNSEVV